MDGKKAVIHWFRKGLRIHDNPALHKACELVRLNKNYVLRPIFILDPDILTWMKVGENRLRFLQQSLLQLHENLISINSRLYVVRGSPKDVFTRVFKEWNVTILTYEYDIEPYAIKRDAAIEQQAQQLNIDVITEISNTIYDPNAVLRRNMGRPPMQYQRFMTIIEDLPIPELYDIPQKLPINSIPTKDSFESQNIKCYEPPTLDEIVADPEKLEATKYHGGETEAISRMEKYLKQTSWVCSFEKPNTIPNSIDPSTTVLSPYIKFGCLSSRLFYKKLQEILSKFPKHSKPPVSLVGQLLWREFFYTAGAAEPHLDRMVGNSICYQIPWEKNDEYLKAWAYGKTGYPFIDAIMRQLRQEGWIHHLARHAVACFLTRVDMWISWEEGQKVFEELLLDADWALNAGNWLWLSASAFFYKYFRVYSPVAFGKKTDPEGKFIKKYCSELKNYPHGIIYEPWKATLEQQREYGCVLGEHYPDRVVIHEDIYKKNLSKMSQAYKKNKELKKVQLQMGGPQPISSLCDTQKRPADTSPTSAIRSSKRKTNTKN